MRTHPTFFGLSALVLLLSACSGSDAGGATTTPTSFVPPAGSTQSPRPTNDLRPAGGTTSPAQLPATDPAAARDSTASEPAPVNDPGGAGAAAAPQQPAPAQPDGVPTEPALALDECGLDTGFAGDEYCILPPPPDKGFQVHIGPASYANPGAYLMQPGTESTEDFAAVSGNDGDVHFYYRQYRMRPGSHHLIVSQAGGVRDAGGRRLGGSQNVAKDNPDRGIVAPENEGIGIPLAGRVPLNVQLHYINTGEKPVLREAWINFWYVPSASVTQQAKEMFANGGLGMNVPARTNTVLGPYSCAITQPGRVLTMYGHRHANAPRFSAWRVRGGARELVYESLDWAEPIVLEFNSVTTNPTPERAAGVQGGHSGILDLMPGDSLEWECEVRNAHDFALHFGNQTYDSEMCILIGDTVGPSVACQFL